MTVDNIGDKVSGLELLSHTIKGITDSCSLEVDVKEMVKVAKCFGIGEAKFPYFMLGVAV